MMLYLLLKFCQVNSDVSKKYFFDTDFRFKNNRIKYLNIHRILATKKCQVTGKTCGLTLGIALTTVKQDRIIMI